MSPKMPNMHPIDKFIGPSTDCTPVPIWKMRGVGQMTRLMTLRGIGHLSPAAFEMESLNVTVHSLREFALTLSGGGKNCLTIEEALGSIEGE